MELKKNKIHSANQNECAEFRVLFYLFFFQLGNFLLSLFSSPKALRLECWQQICYSVHQITSSRWWRIKDSERERNESRLSFFCLFIQRLESTIRFKESPLRSFVISFFFFLTVKKIPYQARQKDVSEKFSSLAFTV